MGRSGARGRLPIIRKERRARFACFSLQNVVAVAAGNVSSYARLGDGTVWASGSFNGFGQLGDGTTQPHSDPQQVPGLDNVTDIKADGHVLTLKTDGTAWAWGLNAQGQLGDGTNALDR